MDDNYSMILPNDPQQYPTTGYEWNEDEEADTPTVFCINDDSKADWAIRKLREEKEELDRLEVLAAQRKSEIDAQMEAEHRRYERRTSYLQDGLKAYFDTVDHRETKTKSTYKLLSGTLVRKKGGMAYNRNDSALADWMQSNGYSDLVKVEKKPMWGSFKRLLKSTESGAVVLADTGEIVEGVTTERKPDVFSVDF